MTKFYRVLGLSGVVLSKRLFPDDNNIARAHWYVRIATNDGVVVLETDENAVIDSMVANGIIERVENYTDNELAKENTWHERLDLAPVGLEPYIFVFGQSLSTLASEISKSIKAGYVPCTDPLTEIQGDPETPSSKKVYYMGMQLDEELIPAKEETVCPDCGKDVTMAYLPGNDEGIYRCKCGWELTVPVGE